MKVYQLLGNAKSWVKGYFGRNEEGDCVNPHSYQAVCWCVVGAIRKCYLDPYNSVLVKLAEHLKQQGWESIPEWNDSETTKHEDVIKVLKELDI
jgi:hypothetical protein